MTESESKISEILGKIEQETGVRYDIEEETISYIENKNDTAHFIDLIKYLFREGYATKDDLPYTPGWGKIRYLLNDNPVHKDGHDMVRPEQISDGVFVETNHSTDAKMRYSKQLIKDFVIE